MVFFLKILNKNQYLRRRAKIVMGCVRCLDYSLYLNIIIIIMASLEPVFLARELSWREKGAHGS